MQLVQLRKLRYVEIGVRLRSGAVGATHKVLLFTISASRGILPQQRANEHSPTVFNGLKSCRQQLTGAARPLCLAAGF